MKVTELTRSALAYRRQKRTLLAQGYRLHAEPCWEIVRGVRQRERIVDVQIAADGKGIYYRLSGDAPAAI